MCTIALAKVQRNYNCYNVYFYECLHNNTKVFCFFKLKECVEAPGLFFLYIFNNHEVLMQLFAFRYASCVKGTS